MPYDEWIKEESAAFEGWDFSRLDGRWQTQGLPWDYAQIVKAALSPDMHILDMGTGGGEFILSLGHPYEHITVTEGYEPNVKLCHERLEPLGITVIDADGGGELPFADGSFDAVINRHESYDEREVARILRDGGRFITQQVAAYNNYALACELLGEIKPPFPEHRSQMRYGGLKKAVLRLSIQTSSARSRDFLMSARSSISQK